MLKSWTFIFLTRNPAQTSGYWTLEIHDNPLLLLHAATNKSWTNFLWIDNSTLLTGWCQKLTLAQFAFSFVKSIIQANHFCHPNYDTSSSCHTNSFFLFIATTYLTFVLPFLMYRHWYLKKIKIEKLVKHYVQMKKYFKNIHRRWTLYVL